MNYVTYTIQQVGDDAFSFEWENNVTRNSGRYHYLLSLVQLAEEIKKRGHEQCVIANREMSQRIREQVAITHFNERRQTTCGED